MTGDSLRKTTSHYIPVHYGQIENEQLSSARDLLLRALTVPDRTSLKRLPSRRISAIYSVFLTTPKSYDMITIFTLTEAQKFDYFIP